VAGTLAAVQARGRPAAERTRAAGRTSKAWRAGARQVREGRRYALARKVAGRTRRYAVFMVGSAVEAGGENGCRCTHGTGRGG